MATEIEQGDFVQFRHLIQSGGYTAMGYGSGYVIGEDGPDHLIIKLGASTHRAQRRHCEMHAKQFRLEV